MPLGSRCGKLWGGVFKGGAEHWACGTGLKHWTEVDVWWFDLPSLQWETLWQWTGFDADTLQEDLSSWVPARGLWSEVCDKQSCSPWELCLELICADTRFKRSYSSAETLCCVGSRVGISTMAGVTRKGSGRPSYYYRFLGKSRLQRQRSRSRSRTRMAANRGNKYYYCYKCSPCSSFSPVNTTRHKHSLEAYCDRIICILINKWTHLWKCFLFRLHSVKVT